MQTEILSEIIKQFPAQSIIFTDLFCSSDSFRSLCSDLYDCQKMMRKLKHEKIINKKLLEEYKKLYEELNKELNSFVFEKRKTNGSYCK